MAGRTAIGNARIGRERERNLDKLLALVSFLILCIFLGVMIFWVREPDLTVVCLVVAAFAAYDFYRLAFRHK